VGRRETSSVGQAKIFCIHWSPFCQRDRRGRDRMVDVFTTTYAISAYHTDVMSSNLDQGEVYNIM
jgi:hypothetical protein